MDRVRELPALSSVNLLAQFQKPQKHTGVRISNRQNFTLSASLTAAHDFKQTNKKMEICMRASILALYFLIIIYYTAWVSGTPCFLLAIYKA